MQYRRQYRRLSEFGEPASGKASSIKWKADIAEEVQRNGILNINMTTRANQKGSDKHSHLIRIPTASLPILDTAMNRKTWSTTNHIV